MIYRCEARDCNKDAKHHTNYGAHYCDEHEERRLRRIKARNQVRYHEAMADIHRIGAEL